MFVEILSLIEQIKKVSGVPDCSLSFHSRPTSDFIEIRVTWYEKPNISAATVYSLSEGELEALNGPHKLKVQARIIEHILRQIAVYSKKGAEYVRTT